MSAGLMVEGRVSQGPVPPVSHAGRWTGTPPQSRAGPPGTAPKTGTLGWPRPLGRGSAESGGKGQPEYNPLHTVGDQLPLSHGKEWRNRRVVPLTNVFYIHVYVCSL